MYRFRQDIAIALVVLTCAGDSAVAAEPQAPSAQALAVTVQQHGAKLDEDRATVRQALLQPEVREVADKVGIDLDRIAATLDTMAPADIAKAAETAEQVSARLKKSQATESEPAMFVSSTTIIISALLIVLLVVALK